MKIILIILLGVNKYYELFSNNKLFLYDVISIS